MEPLSNKACGGGLQAGDVLIFDEIHVQKYGWYQNVSDEAIVDYQIGTSEQQAAAAERLAKAAVESEARWRALPLRTRMYRRTRHLVWRARHR